MKAAASLVGDLLIVGAMTLVMIAADVVYCGIDLVRANRRGSFPMPKGAPRWTK